MYRQDQLYGYTALGLGEICFFFFFFLYQSLFPALWTSHDHRCVVPALSLPPGINMPSFLSRIAQRIGLIHHSYCSSFLLIFSSNFVGLALSATWEIDFP